MLSPEVVFHRYFQESWCPLRNNGYKGKHALESLDPVELGPLLEAIQQAADEGFNSADHIPQHVVHPPFHLDYIDCERTVNAHAFRYEDYSFIGITIPFVYRLWDLSTLLSRSGVIIQPSDSTLTAEEWCERLRVTLFRTAFRFVALHEWTHHVHGHVEEGAKPFSEILDAGERATLQRQVCELDADGYAAHHTLDGLYNQRWALHSLLQLNAVPQNIQDDVLFSCFVLGAGAVMFPLSAGATSKTLDLYRDPHPPQAARVQFLVYQGNRWRARHWPNGETWMPADRFRALMNAVAKAAEVACEVTASAWDAQTIFLVSEEGIAYVNTLEEALTTYTRSLRA